MCSNPFFKIRDEYLFFPEFFFGPFWCVCKGFVSKNLLFSAPSQPGICSDVSHNHNDSSANSALKVIASLTLSIVTIVPQPCLSCILLAWAYLGSVHWWKSFRSVAAVALDSLLHVHTKLCHLASKIEKTQDNISIFPSVKKITHAKQQVLCIHLLNPPTLVPKCQWKNCVNTSARAHPTVIVSQIYMVVSKTPCTGMCTDACIGAQDTRLVHTTLIAKMHIHLRKHTCATVPLLLESKMSSVPDTVRIHASPWRSRRYLVTQTSSDHPRQCGPHLVSASS